MAVYPFHYDDYRLITDGRIVCRCLCERKPDNHQTVYYVVKNVMVIGVICAEDEYMDEFSVPERICGRAIRDTLI